MRIVVYASLLLATALPFPDAAAAQRAKPSRAEKIRLLYMPLNISTLQPVSQKKLETEGDRCLVATSQRVADIRALLALARAAHSEQERFTDKNVRIKLWIVNRRRETQLATIEQDGRMLQGGRSLVLPEKPLHELEQAIADECFGGVTDPFKSPEYRRGEELRRQRTYPSGTPHP
jgi:hypothetical protein